MKKSYERLAHLLVEDYYQNKDAALLSSLTKRNYEGIGSSREKINREIYQKIGEYQNEDGSDLSEEQKEIVMDYVRKEMWGYGIIDDLIHEKDVSDIKTYDYKNIRIKRLGKRYDAGVTFADPESYQDFIIRLLERNKINLGTANAIQTFTDATQDDFVLRITAISGLLTDSGLVCVAIRKIAKDKYDLKKLEESGMFDTKKRSFDVKAATDLLASHGKKEIRRFLSKDKEELDVLMQKMVVSKGILFTGKGASGKTTLMNALIAKIPHDESVMICQENSELFDNEHPDMLSTHVLMNGGDSKISYSLGDLTRAALLVDLDRIIVGEVKEGSEAAGLSKASMTGHKCWTSVHGESCEMAIDKMADYISQATGYSTRDALKQLCGFEYVVHLRNFQIDEIVRIDGWDKEIDEMKLKEVYRLED